jgi:hypothetical protein
MTRVRYAYVVTRINPSQDAGTCQIPNLGVHLSLRKALRHYKSTIDDREKDDPVKTSMYGYDKFSIAGNVKYALLGSYYVRGEEIRLEKWRI